VIYDSAHRRAQQMVRGYLEANAIYSCGRFGEWEYLNMDQAILSGKRAAELCRNPRQVHVAHA
jgi:protoporphyrinogen oxidase